MKKIFFISIFSMLVISFGISVRSITHSYTPSEFYARNNVASYYVDITNRYINTGSIPKIDKWRYSTEEYVENAPPFLALLTRILYLPISYMNISPLSFMAYFNIFLYLVYILIGSMYLYRKFVSFYPVFIFQLLLSFLPFSVYLHNYGRYTEEGLGILLIFLISICEIDRGSKRYWKYIEGSLMIMLLLTWQQFHLIYFIIFASNFLFRKKHLIETIYLIIFTFIGAEVVSRFVLNSNYSPIFMIYEAIFPLIESNKNIIKIAMSRRDWSNLTWQASKAYFSYAGIAVWIFSLINYAYKGHKKYIDKYILLGMIFTLLLTIFFVKSRYILIPYLLLFCSTNFQIYIIKDAKQMRILFLTFVSVACISLMYFFIANHNLLINYNYKPQIKNTISHEELNNDNRKISLTLKNIGQNQTPDKDSFAGFHIEVFNAKVSNIKTNYSFGKSQIIVKKDSQMKDYYWFEVKFYKFDKDVFGNILFDAQKIDINKPIIVKYRSWIPGYCSLFDRIDTMNVLTQDYSLFNNSWRSESCIVRSPANVSQNEKVCDYKVYAAHVQRQTYKCYEEYIE